MQIGALYSSHGPIKRVELQDCSFPVTKERVKGLPETDTTEELNSAEEISALETQWLYTVIWLLC